MANLTKLKGIHQATELIQEEATDDKWPVDIMSGALAAFLSSGFKAKDITIQPGGFTVFMVAPIGHLQSQSKELLEQRMKETFGDGELSVPFRKSTRA